MPLSAALITGGLGVVKAGKGIIDDIAAKNKLKTLVAPKFDISQEIYKNQNLAENQAQSGFSGEAKQFYGDQSDRALSAGISGILQSGGDPNSIADIYDKYNTSNQKFAADDSQLKAKNLETLMQTNSDLAGQERMKWAMEELQPYKDKMAAYSQDSKAAQQNIFAGIGDIASSAAAYSEAKNYDGLDEKGVTMGEKRNRPQIGHVASAGVTLSPGTNYHRGPTDLVGLSEDEILKKKAQRAVLSTISSPYLNA